MKRKRGRPKVIDRKQPNIFWLEGDLSGKLKKVAKGKKKNASQYVRELVTQALSGES